MQLITTPGAAPQTMTSIELVDFINSDREAASTGDTFAVLSHSDFYKKAKIVLGEGVGKFSDTQQNPQNKQFYPIYRFPKREACLMAMSYSYDLQAKVFDRMTALEVTDPLAGLPPEQRALIALMVDNAAIKAVQAAQAVQIEDQAEALKRIESNQAAAVASVQSFTALGYSIYKEIPMSKIELIRLGKRASAISKKKGVTIDHVADGRHGRVGSYHVSVLDEALEELTK